MTEPTGPGWTRADEALLGDRMQELIRRDDPGPEDPDAERRLMENTLALWQSYETGDDE